METARRLVAAGYRVYLTARNPALGDAAAAGIGAWFLELDVTSDESADRADLAAPGGRPERSATATVTFPGNPSSPPYPLTHLFWKGISP